LRHYFLVPQPVFLPAPAKAAPVINVERLQAFPSTRGDALQPCKEAKLGNGETSWRHAMKTAAVAMRDGGLS
jgi:hypothetical protein